MRTYYCLPLFLLVCCLFLSGCSSTTGATKPTESPTEVLAILSTEAPSSDSVEESVKPFDKTYTKSELEADFNVLVGTIRNKHPKLYTDQKALDDLVQSQFGLIKEGMTELSFLRIVAPIVSKLNCGHTSIMLSKDYQDQLKTEGKYFPLPIRFIGDKAYIIQNGLAPLIPVGSELLSINGQSIKEIKTLLFAHLSSDGLNETHKTMLINGWFRYRYQNFIDTQESYDITYTEKTSGEIKVATLDSVTNEIYATKNTSIWNESDIPYTSSFQEDYALLTMYSFYPEGSYSISQYKDFMDDFFLQVKEKKLSHVILDVRDNGGGDPYVTSHLFSYLAKKSQPYFTESAIDYYAGLKSTVPLAENHYEGDLYVLMNGGSFSSTGHLLALLKSQNVGTFIGEESAGSFACTDGSQSMTLPNTQIQYRGSTLIWEVVTEGLTPGRGIMPDYPVTQTIEDYLGQKDVVLKTALDLLKSKP